MQSTEAVHFERKVWGICLIGAPLLMAVSYTHLTLPTTPYV